MPNHITNILDVTGPAKDVKAFKRKVWKEKTDQYGNISDGTFDFESTVPIPEELRDNATDEKYKANKIKYGYENWYDFSIANWGTKWNAYDVIEPESIDGGLRFQFNTAWSPPTEWLTKTALLFPTLSLVDSWIDEGGGAGRISLENDSVTDIQIEDHDWRLEYDELYREEYEMITESSYEKFIEKFTQPHASIDWYDMEEHLLKRIKDMDLPRFLTFEWNNEGVSDAYQERIKNAVIS